MFVELLKKDIEAINNKVPISRWDSIDKAKEFYSKQEGKFTCYIDNNITNAMATPVKVFLINN